MILKQSILMNKNIVTSLVFVTKQFCCFTFSTFFSTLLLNIQFPNLLDVYAYLYTTRHTNLT
jgi:hypothetical protein